MKPVPIDSPPEVTFRLRAVLDHPIELREPAAFELHGNRQLDLRRANADDQRWTSDQPREKEFHSSRAPRQRDIVVVVRGRRRLPRQASGALREMAANRRPQGSAEIDAADYKTYGETAENHVRRDDYIGWSHVTPHEELPEAIQTELGKAFEEVWEALRHAWRVIRWRRSLFGKALPLSPFGFEASFDAETWVPLAVPDDGDTWQRPLARHLKIDAQTRDELASLLLEIGGEPTPAHMLVEAFDSVNDAPQSALLIGIAAAETATKEFIARQCPGAEKLVMTMASPPLLKLLTETVPQVLENRTPPAASVVRPERAKEGFTDPVLRALEKGVQMRNLVSHRGARVDAGKVRDVLAAASDILYLLEHYSGAEWALQRIRPETRRAWFLAANEDAPAPERS